MVTARFLIFLILSVTLDLATPIVPTPTALDWDDDEGVREIRRAGRERRLSDARPAPRPFLVIVGATQRFSVPLARRDCAPSRWLVPPRRPHIASLDSASSPEDH